MWEWILQSKEVAHAMGADQYAFITALAAAIAVIITSLRKRKDVDITEVLSKNATMEERVGTLERKVDALQTELVRAETDRFILRRTLASHGIPDPTLEAS